jgi:uncharacterized repeat protein (TIGR01451 family)
MESFGHQVRTVKRPMAAAAMLVLMATAGIANAKSMFVVARIINFDAPIPIHVYDIGPDGMLTYQTEFGAPFIGAGMVGIAMDSDSGYLFSTYEDSGFVLVTNATTLQRRDTLSVQNASSLAGVVFDHQKKLLYCAAHGGDSLYVLNWDPLKGKLNPVLGSPFTLKGAMIYGIALDEYNDLLYVASPTQGIAVYSTWDWSLVRTEMAGQVAISIAVDPERDYLYYGGGYAGNFYLTRRKISDWSKREVLVDPNAGVMGLGVDPDTGLVYITTGEENRPGGKDLMVYSSNLELLQTVEDIGRPTGLAIPIGNTSFNPLNVAKTVKNPLGGKPNNQGLYFVVIGDLVTYSISFDEGGHSPTEIIVVDKLPTELVFVSATGHGSFGRYDATAHTYTWQNPPLTPGARTSLELVCRVQPHTPPGQIITNRVTIDSDKTPPSTVSVGAIATEAIYNPLNIRKVVVSPEPPAGDSSILYARPGDEVTYRVHFDNKDNDYTVSNIVIVDALPQHVQFVSATGDGVFGAYDRGIHTYTWTYPSLAAGGADSVDLTVRLSENIPAGAVITNRATIKSDQTPQVSKGADVTVAFAPLDIEKTVVSPVGEVDDRGRTYVGAGERVTYAVRFHNPSRDVAITQITIVDQLPPELTFITATGNGDYGSYDSIDHKYTWNYPLLPAGGEVRLELAALVRETVEPNEAIVNIVTVTSKQAAPSKTRTDVVVGIRSIQGQMFLKPTRIWRNQSPTPDLMVVVHLPEGYGMETIANTPLVLTPGGVPSTSLRIFGTSEQGKILCFFDTAAILAATQGHGEFPIRVAGKLHGGRSFVCEGSISILKYSGP